jgi:NAD(P)H-flavin reductase
MKNAAKTLPARVAGIDRAAADIYILRLDLESPPPPVLAGQYAFLECAGYDRRAFSIASDPGKPLEFHIRDTGHGFGAHVAQGLRAGDSLRVTLPFGDCFWQGAARPQLLLAGGIGITAVLPILRAHLAGAATPIHLYWGVKDAGQLYLHDDFMKLAAAHPQFRYVPLTQAPEAGFRSGFAGTAAVLDIGGFAGFDIYMAGPLPMIEATVPLLLSHGAEKERVFSDAFSV